ncbi:hypothetical protein F2Q70_00017160 [Brassica cretica]|uniref:Uncharacterized protein n=1 Tax=Brassica cretica TaxID=69181 RepID=A0A8S9I5I4_BRACR|nr:hypothetical protein F2Q70_00017160 [Brassica cretica]KAF2569464.1 hypothetical protein F2Q68_00025142 [Brassica cretica]
MTSPLRSICCSRTIRIISMSWKKPIWNQVLQMLQHKPRHRKKISKRSVTSMGRVGSSKTTIQILMRNNPHLFSYKTNPDNPNERSEGNQFQNTGYQKPYFQNHNQNGKMFILSQAQNQFQNRQNNPQAAPATASGPPDELKEMM